MMQSLKRFLTTFTFWVVIFQLVAGAYSFNCSICDGLQCRNGEESTQECSTDYVKLNYQLLSFLNPTLPDDVPPNPTYGCFSLDLTYISPLTGSSVKRIRKGCTLTEPDICNGWTDSVLDQTCNACSTENCNAAAQPPTATPPTPEASTTTASSTAPTPPTAQPPTQAPTSSSAATASPTTAGTTTSPGSTTSTVEPDKGGAVSVSQSIVGVLIPGVVTLLLVQY